MKHLWARFLSFTLILGLVLGNTAYAFTPKVRTSHAIKLQARQQETAVSVLPDLTISNISVSPSSPLVTDDVLVTVTIANEGDVTVDPGNTPFRIQVYDSKGWGNSQLLEYSVQRIEPGDTYDVSLYLPYKYRGVKLLRNPHSFLAKVDTENTISESDENNNEQSFDIRFRNDLLTRMDDLRLSDHTESSEENPIVLEWTNPARGDYSNYEIRYYSHAIGWPDSYDIQYYTQTTEADLTYYVGYLDRDDLDEIENWYVLEGIEDETHKTDPEHIMWANLTGPATYTFVARYAKSDGSGYVYSNAMRFNYEGAEESALLVSFNEENPEGATLPKGATNVEFLRMDFTAQGNEDIELDGITFDRSVSLGVPQDFAALYLYEGDRRLTNAKIVQESLWSTDQHVEFYNLGLTVPAGETLTLSLVATIASSAMSNDENGFEIENESAVSASAPVVFQDDMDGEIFTISSVSAGALKIVKSGAISNPAIGQLNAKIAEFQLQPSGEDALLQRITLSLGSSMYPQDNLEHFILKQGSIVLAQTDAVDDNDLAVFSLDSLLEFAKNGTYTFEVYADVTEEARANDKVQVYLDESIDVFAYGKQFGWGMQVNDSDYDGDQTVDSDGDGAVPDSSNSTVKGGQVTIAFNGPAATQVSSNEKDVVFLDLTFTTQRNIDVRQLVFTVAATAASGQVTPQGLLDSSGPTTIANFSDIRLKDATSGTMLMGPGSLSTNGSDSSQTVTFTEHWSMQAGTSKDVQLIMDIRNDADLNGNTVRVQLNAISSTEGIKDLDSGIFISDIVPSTAILGNLMTVQEASMTVTLATSPVSNTVVKGSRDVPITGFVFTAGDADDMTITGVMVQCRVTSDGGSSYTTTNVNSTVASVELLDADGNVVGEAENIDATAGTASFTNVNWTIAAGTSEKLIVSAPQISTTAPQNSGGDDFACDLTNSSSVTAEKSDGSIISVTVSAPNGGTSPTVVLSVESSGSLSVVASGVSLVTDAKYVAGTDNVLAARYRAAATYEDFLITDLTIQVDNLSTASTNDVEGVYLKYPNSNGTILTSPTQPLVTSGSRKYANFSGLTFYVPKDKDNIVFEVYLNTATIESGAAVSGSRIRATFDADSTSIFAALGQSSGVQATENDVASSDLSNNNHVALYKSVPTFAANTTASGCPTSSTDPVTGENNIYCFNVTAASNGSVDLAQVTLEIGTSGIIFPIGGITLSLYDHANQSIALDTDTLTAATDTTAVFNLATADTIASGTTVTYIVKGNATIDSDAQSVSISARVLDESSSTGFAANAAAASLTNNRVVWSDRSASSHSLTTADWTNGYKVAGLPTSQVSMSL